MKRFSNKTRESIRGLMMGCFMINLFMSIVVFDAWVAGIVPDHLIVLILGSAVLCLYGWWDNRDRQEEDDEQT